MEKKITVSLPLNIAPGESRLFEPYTAYIQKPQKIKLFRNVFVTHSGLCLNNKGLIKECHHDFPGQYNDYLGEAAKYYYEFESARENGIILDDEHTYLVIHHPWVNYYHWICESIFRLWLVRRRLDKLVLALPEYHLEADFVAGSLEPFKIKRIYAIPYEKSIIARRICLPQIKPVCDSYNGLHIRQVSSFYRNYVQYEKKINMPRVDKLYISRGLAPRRQILNEPEIIDVLHRYGFTVFYPEKASFLEQVAIFSSVKYLVGMHGSGLTNLLFMPKGANVLELHKNRTNDLDHPSPLFWYMAAALGICYYRQSCDTGGQEDYFEGNYIVDAALFEENLRKMLK